MLALFVTPLPLPIVVLTFFSLVMSFHAGDCDCVYVSGRYGKDSDLVTTKSIMSRARAGERKAGLAPLDISIQVD